MDTVVMVAVGINTLMAFGLGVVVGRMSVHKRGDHGFLGVASHDIQAGDILSLDDVQTHGLIQVHFEEGPD